MKFSPGQLVVILAVLMAAIVCAHVFAPGAVAIVTSMASTLFAVLFVERQKEVAPPDPPALKIIQGGKSDGDAS